MKFKKMKFKNIDSRDWLNWAMCDEIDYPLHAIQQMDEPSGMVRFFPMTSNPGVMPPTHVFLVEGYEIKLLDTDPLWRDAALAVAFCEFKLLIARREGASVFSGADFLDFTNQKFIVRKAAVPVIIQSLVSFGLAFDFKDASAFEKIKRKKMGFTLLGKHYRAK